MIISRKDAVSLYDTVDLKDPCESRLDGRGDEADRSEKNQQYVSVRRISGIFQRKQLPRNRGSDWWQFPRKYT